MKAGLTSKYQHHTHHPSTGDGVVASEVALLDSHIVCTEGIETKHATKRLKEGT